LPPVPHRLRGIIVGSVLLLALPFLANDAAAQLPADRCDACAKEKAARDEAEKLYRKLFEEKQLVQRSWNAFYARPAESRDPAELDRLNKSATSLDKPMREQLERISRLQQIWLDCLGAKCPDVKATLDRQGPRYFVPLRRKVCVPCERLALDLSFYENALAREQLTAGILERALNDYTNKVLAGTLTRTEKDAYEAYRHELERVQASIQYDEDQFYLALARLEKCVKSCTGRVPSAPPGGAGDGATFQPIKVCPACQDLADKLDEDVSTLQEAQSDDAGLLTALNRYPRYPSQGGAASLETDWERDHPDFDVAFSELTATQRAEVDALLKRIWETRGIIDRLKKRVVNERRELEKCVKDPKCAPPKGASVVPGAGAGPTLEEMRRAQELTKGDSGQGGMYVSPSLQDPPVQRTVPIIPPGATGRPSMPTPVPQQTPAPATTPAPQQMPQQTPPQASTPVPQQAPAPATTPTPAPQQTTTPAPRIPTPPKTPDAPPPAVTPQPSAPPSNAAPPKTPDAPPPAATPQPSAPPSNAAPPKAPAPPTPAKPPAPPSPPQPAPQNSGSSSVTPSPAPAATGFAGNWKGNGGCGFASLGISQQGNVLTLQGLPGNGSVRATSDGNGAQAQGVVMLGKPNYEVMLFVQGNRLAFEAISNTDSCRDDLRRQ